MGASTQSREGADPPLEGWWAPVEGTSSPDVHGKVEREINQGRDELDVLARGIEAPAGSQVDVVFADRVVATAPLERKRRLFGGADGRVRITVDATSLPPMRTGDRLVLQVDGRPVAQAELQPD